MRMGRREVVAAAGGLGLSGTAYGGSGDRIRVGVVGCGQRGAWIAGLFARHGGYEVTAVSDYFPDVAERCGSGLGVPASRCFSGLGGYRKLMGSGVQAVALETPPYCFPEHARAAVAAGLHVFMAKPVAADVVGCLSVQASAAAATAKGKTFLVDYQIPTDPGNMQVVEQIRSGAIGEIVAAHSYYLASAWSDPPMTRTIADRLQRLIWVNDTAIGGGYHGNACIHAVDALMWAVDAVPVAAMGASRIGRPDPHGDSHDVISVTYEFANGLVANHRAKHLADHMPTSDFCGCYLHGRNGYAWISYSAKAQLVSSDDAVTHDVTNLYEAGAQRNIAAFHDAIRSGDARNPTVRRAIDSALATIMGREAARRRSRLSMKALLAEKLRLPVNLKGLNP